MEYLTRRRFIEVSASAVAALGLAGCTGSSQPTTTTTEESAASTPTVTEGTLSTYDIIHAKRHGEVISDEHIRQIVNDYCADNVTDAQMASFMMAVCCNGMTDGEAATLTATMVDSGEKLDFTSSFPAETIVDKHSTGGVGDKTSFVIAPALAALGLKDPMMSGRGLGITGGTLDKLESIPGFNISLTADQILSQLNSIGFVICGQTSDIAPADKKMYALRDETATIDSIPLITSSIMSKKIAEGTKNLVVDLKCGRAAFMTDEEDARALASLMESVGAANGVNTKCLLTNMDMPLGRCVGNAVEIEEIVAILEGGADATTPTFWEDITELGALAVELTFGDDHDAAISRFEDAITSGAALQKFRDMCQAQGGDLDAFDTARLDGVSEYPVTATQAGYISDVDAEAIGVVVRDLGGGRVKSTDPVNHQVGITNLVYVGEKVAVGDVLANIRITAEQDAAQIAAQVAAAITISDSAIETPSNLL